MTGAGRKTLLTHSLTRPIDPLLYFRSTRTQDFLDQELISYRYSSCSSSSYASCLDNLFKQDATLSQGQSAMRPI